MTLFGAECVLETALTDGRSEDDQRRIATETGAEFDLSVINAIHAEAALRFVDANGLDVLGLRELLEERRALNADMEHNAKARTAANFEHRDRLDKQAGRLVERAERRRLAPVRGAHAARLLEERTTIGIDHLRAALRRRGGSARGELVRAVRILLGGHECSGPELAAALGCHPSIPARLARAV